MEILIRILLFILCLAISKLYFDFSAISIGVLLGLYNLCVSLFETSKRTNLKIDHKDDKIRLKKENDKLIDSEKSKYASLLKSIIRDNNQTFNKLVTLINSLYSLINIDQQKTLLSSLVSEIEQQINYTGALCEIDAELINFKNNIKPLIDFKYSIVKQLQGKRPIKGIDFNKLLEQLRNLEDKINVR